MTADEFRSLALELPEATEGQHMGHPDFRVRGKIFATLSPPGEGWGTVKLRPDQQAAAVKADPDAFEPVPGGWGRQGYTRVFLSAATPAALRPALANAWRNTAPKKLVKEFDSK